MTAIPFTKMAGTGNDFVLVDALRHDLAPLRRQWAALAVSLCDRRKGIGADGLLVLDRSRVADVRMRIFNPDGSEPSMCGNGVRCLALYAARHGVARRPMRIETGAGIKRAEVKRGNRVRVDMGIPTLLAHFPRLSLQDGGACHADWLNTGVPHVVCWVDRVERVDVPRRGRWLRTHRRFQPDGANVDFVAAIEPVEPQDVAQSKAAVHRLRVAMRTYERGVEGETQACGTGAIAAAASAAHRALLSPSMKRTMRASFRVEVRVPGGVLRVELSAARSTTGQPLRFGHAFLEGRVRRVSQGRVAWEGNGGGSA